MDICEINALMNEQFFELEDEFECIMTDLPSPKRKLSELKEEEVPHILSPFNNKD